MKQLSKIKSLLQTEFWLHNVKLKMLDASSLIVEIPSIRWNNECIQEFSVTPNKIKEVIKNKLSQQLDIIMIF